VGPPDDDVARGARGQEHLAHLGAALATMDLQRLRRWGQHLAAVLAGGGRLLAAGNGGSAAEAQHLTSELVGRFKDDREPLSAIALHADTSAVTALGNDYGYAEIFARQVRAHGRAGDVLMLLSTSGRSENLLRAAAAGRDAGLKVWALTGPSPNPLAAACDDAMTISAAATGTIQECHLVAIHLICASVDAALGVRSGDAAQQARPDPEPAPRARPALSRRSPDRRRGPLVVAGDSLLDRDVAGEVERVSPEAPVPVVDRATSSFRPGGAGLAALLAARDGRRVTLVTALCPDDAGRRLAGLLEASGVDVIDLGSSGPTPVKIRIRADGRSLLMVSEAPREPGRIRRPLTEGERRAIAGAAAVLVSDYGGGIGAQPSVRDAVGEAVTRIPVVWDVHPRGAEPVKGIRLVTPNAREAEHLSGIHGDGLAFDIDRARALVGMWSAASVAVTRGRDGAILLDGADALPVVIAAPLGSGGDACGAGDCFAATAAGLLADGALVSEAVAGAVEAASGFVAAGGAHAVGLPAAAPPSAGAPSGIDERTAHDVVASVRATGGAVVATAGCFDLLHAGHVAMLARARALGDCLIVCLNSDESVRRLKGEGRPIVTAHDRAAVLEALTSVDAVVTFDEDRPDRVLGQIRPDFYVKGGDYRIGDVLEAALVASWKGRTVILPYIGNRSTSGIIDKIANVG
jgi:D-beta-D-heptose 7-phosphate kinase/D-beta-D-heptose 1-phosphate adenosyltransferase